MTAKLFSDAMNEIGAKYVEEALTYKRPAQRSFWSKLAKRAAMVALVALLALKDDGLHADPLQCDRQDWAGDPAADHECTCHQYFPSGAHCRKVS